MISVRYMSVDEITKWMDDSSGKYPLQGQTMVIPVSVDYKSQDYADTKVIIHDTIQVLLYQILNFNMGYVPFNYMSEDWNTYDSVEMKATTHEQLYPSMACQWIKKEP